MPRSRTLCAPLLAMGLMLTGLAIPTIAAPIAHGSQRPAATPWRQLTITVTTVGITTVGKVNVSYRIGNRHMHGACSILQCIYRMPSSTRVTLSETSLKASKYPFRFWTITMLDRDIGSQNLRKGNISLVMKHNFRAEAVYKVK